MFEIKLNWKFLVAFYVLTFGIRGYLLKLVSGKLDWKTVMFYVWISLTVVYFASIFKYIHFRWSKFHILAILAGIIAAFGTMAFYKALSLASASVIIPLTAHYILGTVLLWVISLKGAYHITNNCRCD